MLIFLQLQILLRLLLDTQILFTDNNVSETYYKIQNLNLVKIQSVLLQLIISFSTGSGLEKMNALYKI